MPTASPPLCLATVSNNNLHTMSRQSRNRLPARYDPAHAPLVAPPPVTQLPPVTKVSFPNAPLSKPHKKPEMPAQHSTTAHVRFGQAAAQDHRNASETVYSPTTQPRMSSCALGHTACAVPGSSPGPRGTPPRSGVPRPVGGQVAAGPEHAGGLAGQPERHDRTPPLTGPEVDAEQLGRAVNPRPTHVGYR